MNVVFKFIELFNHFSFCLIDGIFYFGGINIHWCQLLKILFRLVDYDFKGFYFMTFMGFIVTYTADDTVLDTFRFETY